MQLWMLMYVSNDFIGFFAQMAQALIVIAEILFFQGEGSQPDCSYTIYQSIHIKSISGIQPPKKSLKSILTEEGNTETAI